MKKSSREVYADCFQSLALRMKDVKNIDFVNNDNSVRH